MEQNAGGGGRGGGAQQNKRKKESNKQMSAGKFMVGTSLVLPRFTVPQIKFPSNPGTFDAISVLFCFCLCLCLFCFILKQVSLGRLAGLQLIKISLPLPPA